MIGGSVWGRPTLGSSSTPPLTSSLARQFDKIGLDGPICAEYILSLLDMYKSPGDRSAAISDFVMDSISTSSTLTDSQHNQFVAEILEIVGSGGSRGGSGAVTKPSVAQQISSSENQTSEPVVSKKGFKKGTKLTGMALKQVVGTVKPSFVQKYSDDETSEQVVRRPISSTMHLTQPAMVVRSISSNSRQSVDPQYFPSLDANSSNGSTSSTSRVTPPETPQMQSPSPPLGGSASAAAAVSNKKKKNSKIAREVGPDEVWSGDELQESDDGAEFKTPFTSLKEEKKKKQANDAPNSTRKQLSLTGFNSIKISPPSDKVVVKEEPLTTPPPPTNKIVSILDTTPPAAALEPSLLIPQDILSFDFQFEGESDEEKAAAVPETETFDLLRQMFGGFSTNTTTSVVEPPKIAAPTLNAPSALAKSDREYSTNFLLHVLSSMGPDGVEKPHELQALCVQGEHKRRSPHGDMNGSWRSNNKDTAKSPGVEKEAADHKEEGFW